MATRRRRLDPQQRRLEIIEAADRFLARDGNAVRVEDVVSEAGAAKGTFYLYFPTWGDLLDTLRARLFETFDRQHPLEDVGTTADRLASLERVAAAFVDRTVEMGGMHAALFHSDFAQRRPLPAKYDPVHRLAGFIRRGNEAGVFSVPDPEPAARLLFAVIHETADAVAEGKDRASTLATMMRILNCSLLAKGSGTLNEEGADDEGK